jgi:uncharacterized protein YacL
MVIREVIFMSQEIIIKSLIISVLLYLGVPVLRVDGSILQTIFTLVWSGFACFLLLSLAFKKRAARKRTVWNVKKNRKQNTEKRTRMES